MIQANELRIGNYFLGYNGIVFQWSLNDFQLMWVDVEIDEIIKEPIPLTEEWILNFGFEKGCIYSQQRGFTSPCRDYFFENNINCLKEIIDGNILSCIKSVHQLQNLYFALTGTELTIK